MAEIATKEVVSLTHLQKQGHGQAAVQMLGLLELSVLVHFRCAVISNMAITKTQYVWVVSCLFCFVSKVQASGSLKHISILMMQ